MIFFLGGVHAIRKVAKNQGEVSSVAAVYPLLLFLSLTVFIIEPWNKLHLLWVIPLFMAVGGIIFCYVSVHIPFIGKLHGKFLLVLLRIFCFGIYSDSPKNPDS